MDENGPDVSETEEVIQPSVEEEVVETETVETPDEVVETETYTEDTSEAESTEG